MFEGGLFVWGMSEGGEFVEGLIVLEGRVIVGGEFEMGVFGVAVFAVGVFEGGLLEVGVLWEQPGSLIVYSLRLLGET